MKGDNRLWLTLKQKIKDNKYKILTGIIFISGVAYVIINQNNKLRLQEARINQQDLEIQNLKDINATQQKDIGILKSVMSGTVLSNLRDSTKRQLRYAEGRLRNGLEDGTISAIDEQLRRDEIITFSKQLENIDMADKMISNKTN